MNYGASLAFYIQWPSHGQPVNPFKRVGDSFSYFSDFMGGVKHVYMDQFAFSGSIWNVLIGQWTQQVHTVKRCDWSAYLLLGVPQFDSCTAK